jgi:ubiquinol-cytochrome c reductase cytochrome b subunit
MKVPSPQSIYGWINQRFPLAQIMAWGLHEKIPGGTRFSYTLGSSCLFLFILQVITGVWTLFYFVPSVDHAYASLNYLRLEVPFGWLIHGFHYWGAHAFTIVVGLHVIRVFIWGAYKKPRELVWIAGVFLIILTALFMFTGPVLPWDKKGYWAGKVGIAIAASTPFLGNWIEHLLQGADKFGQLGLMRFFVIHVAILPAITMGFIAIHLVAFRQYGSIGPWDEKKAKARTGEFWPEQLFKDAVIWFGIFVLLVWLSAFHPAPISGLADPMDTLYTPKPEWTFLFLYEILKYFSGPLEPIGTVGVPMLIMFLLFSLPFFDKSPERNPFKRGFVMFCGFLFVFFVLGLTAISFYRNPPQHEQAEMRLQQMKQIEQKIRERTPIGELAGVRQPAAQRNPSNPRYGEKLFHVLGCIECHSTVGRSTGKEGPDLLMVLNTGVPREWLWVQIVAPEKHNPYTVMPPYVHLRDDQIHALIDFLEELAAKKPQNSASDAIASGQKLFQTLGCAQCHNTTGEPGHKQGPDLSVSLSDKKVTRDWLSGQILNPKKHNLNTVMPSFNHLADHQVNALIAFLENLSSRKRAAAASHSTEQEQPAPPNVSQAPSDDEPEAEPEENQQKKAGAKTGVGQSVHIVGNGEHGLVLYQENCARCHGPEGKVNASDSSSLPGVPSLVPIRKELYSTDPQQFVRNIDGFLQHGVNNRAGGPNMPALGDTHTLTQAQMADIEAYVLKVNGVNREKILRPGVEPTKFFFILLAISGLMIVWYAIYAAWTRKTR